jgi:signal transduction histidine kinase
MADVSIRQETLQRIALRMREEGVTLAKRWLDGVHELGTVSRLEVFPTGQLLDHIPEVLTHIARYVETAEPPIDTDRELAKRAAALGELRHIQHGSVHQLLREYSMLADLLEEFIESEVKSIDDADPRAVAVAMRRVGESVRTMQQHTVDTFVANYTGTLERQTIQLRNFSRLVSHEIRQPLAVLQVLARALPVNSTDESIRMMDILERSVTRLAEVTGKLERLARVTRATDLDPSERKVDLTDVAHEAAAQLSAAASERDVDVRVHQDLPVVRMDPARAELIFVNLIANGIKFADPDKKVRYVEIHGGSSDEPTVIVRDNGVGMTPPRLQTVFREFVRAHSQRDDDVRAWGLGLGLSIVRECMDHANGWVRVDSIEGRGTTFKLSWPPAAASEEPTAASR